MQVAMHTNFSPTGIPTITHKDYPHGSYADGPAFTAATLEDGAGNFISIFMSYGARLTVTAPTEAK